MRQAIILTNADPLLWLIYAALGGDELSVGKIHSQTSMVNLLKFGK